VAQEIDACGQLLGSFFAFWLGSPNGKFYQELKEQGEREAGVFLPLSLSALQPPLW